MARKRQFRFLTSVGIGAAALALTFTGIAPATATATPTKTQSKVTDYVNLGDSYSAGYGSGTPIPNPIIPAGCFKGSGASHVTALDARPGINLTVDAACAGFTTTQIKATVPLLATALAGAELVTLTLGANDLDIRGLVIACSTLGSDAACDGALRLGNLAIPAVGASAHQTLHTLDDATRGKILVLGYPRLFTTSNGDQPLITAKRAKQLNRLGDALNLAIKNATKRTSAKFVSVTGAFNNHGLGANKPWIYFNQVLPAGLDAPFNLHPTTTGYLKGYFPAVKRAL